MEIYGDAARSRAWAYLECHNCKIETIHTLVYASSQGDFVTMTDLETGIVEKSKVDAWLLWECAGCERLVVVEMKVNPDWFEDDSIEISHPGFSTARYPKMTYVSPRYFKKIPEKIDHLYKETIAAYNNELWVLCAAGLRSLLEGICDDKEKSKKHARLDDKIKSLAKLGIPANMIQNLHSFRFMGNKAVHELTAPEEEHLQLAIEIIEDILNYLYDLDYKLTLLSQRQRTGPNYVVAEEDQDLEESE